MSKLNPKEHTKLSNQSLVFESFGDDEKMTITQATERINTKVDFNARLSDRTIRRAILELVSKGFLREYGRSNNAMLYGKMSASLTEPNQPLIPNPAGMMTVEEFIRFMAATEMRPLRLKQAMMGEKYQHVIRRRMVFAVMSAAQPGFENQLKEVNQTLNDAIAELEYALAQIKTFVDSPIWYSQYRERMGYEIRRMQEKDPELFQLAVDYVKGD